MSTTNMLLALFGAQAVGIVTTWLAHRLHMKGNTKIATLINGQVQTSLDSIEGKVDAAITKKIGG